MLERGLDEIVAAGLHDALAELDADDRLDRAQRIHDRERIERDGRFDDLGGVRRQRDAPYLRFRPRDIDQFGGKRGNHIVLREHRRR